MTSPPLLEPVRTIFRAIAVSVVPECTDMSADEWAEFDGIVERHLATRSEASRKQLLLFIRTIEALPVARYATRFSRLDAARQQQVLTGLQNSRIDALRRSFWGLRTLIFMGYYARPTAASAVGYRGSAEGWAARRLTSHRSAPDD
ncbi:MAG: gluconate 2-dehydrogenase subunit 3 family protein [Gemmatimonadaceae bacterium]